MAYNIQLTVGNLAGIASHYLVRDVLLPFYLDIQI